MKLETQTSMDNNFKVLSVEDDLQWQSSLREIVSSLGYDINSASTFREGIELLSKTTHVLAILDLSLNRDPKDRQGLQIAEAIHKLGEGTRMIVLTAFGQIEDTRKAFRDYEVDDFLEKTQSVEEIEQSIQRSARKGESEIIRPARMATVLDLIDADVISTFEETAKPTVGIGSILPKLERFLIGLVGRYLPLLADRSPALFYKDQFVNFSIRARFWSKRRTKPIGVWFGEHSGMQKLFDTPEFKKTCMEIGYGKELHRVFEMEAPLQEFAGAVFELGDTSFGEFDNPIDFQD